MANSSKVSTVNVMFSPPSSAPTITPEYGPPVGASLPAKRPALADDQLFNSLDR
jgi:hypothetical protein